VVVVKDWAMRAPLLLLLMPGLLPCFPAFGLATCTASTSPPPPPCIIKIVLVVQRFCCSGCQTCVHAACAYPPVLLLVLPLVLLLVLPVLLLQVLEVLQYVL